MYAHIIYKCTCTSAVPEQSLVGMNLIHKCCAQLCLYKLVREVAVCLLMRANKPETAVQSSASFFSWHHMVFVTYVCTYSRDKNASNLVLFPSVQCY